MIECGKITLEGASVTDDLTNPKSHNRLVAASKPAEPTFESNFTGEKNRWILS